MVGLIYFGGIALVCSIPMSVMVRFFCVWRLLNYIMWPIFLFRSIYYLDIYNISLSLKITYSYRVAP